MHHTVYHLMRGLASIKKTLLRRCDTAESSLFKPFAIERRTEDFGHTAIITLRVETTYICYRHELRHRRDALYEGKYIPFRLFLKAEVPPVSTVFRKTMVQRPTKYRPPGIEIMHSEWKIVF